MQTHLKNILKYNSLFFLNIFILAFLIYGLWHSYGNSYLGQVFIYLISFVGSYLIINRLSTKSIKEISFNFLDDKGFKILIDVFIFFVLIFQIIHYLNIGNVPIIKAMMTTDYYYITQIRQDIKSVNSTIINYTASFTIKSLIPILLYILYDKDKKRYWILFLLSVFYALALMQKAYIVTIFIPLILNLLLTRRWLHAGFLVGVFMTGVVFLVLVTNPELRPFQSVHTESVQTESVQAESSEGESHKFEPDIFELDLLEPDIFELDQSVPDHFKSTQEADSLHSEGNAAMEVSDALYKRVFVTTGKMVGHWFFFVPDSLPYLNGSGYRFLAPLKAQPYRDYSREIYDKVYRKEAAMGFTGTATTAFFMYDYANFGNAGLIMAGAFLAFFLVLIKRVFKNDPLSMFALNGLFIIWLSSAAFSTTLFSGGWILTILLYLLFKPYFSIQKLKLQGAEKNH